MAKTLQQALDECETAITAVSAGQEYATADGRRLVRADLGILYAERDRLQAAIAAESGSAFGQLGLRLGRRV